MSSAAQNDENQGVSHSGNQPNNSSENGGQDPRLANESEEEEVLGDYIPADHPETCQACQVKDDEIRLITNQFTEKEELCHTLLQSLKAKQAKLESMEKDNDVYTQCRHELNHLRVLVQNILILDIPIVEDHFGPDRIFMDEVKPSSGKVGNIMLLELPSGIWGQARSIQVESAKSKEIAPQLVSSSNADYYIAKDFTEYHQQRAI